MKHTRFIVAACILLAGFAAMSAAQAPPPPGQDPNFTGVVTTMDAKDVTAGRRNFEPGARTAWHSHDQGQLIYAEKGRLRTGRRGQGYKEYPEGGSEYTPPNVEHWHGATPKEALVQVNIQFGGATKWLVKTTDEEYNRRVQFTVQSSEFRVSTMDPVVRLLKDLVAIDSVNPSLVAGAAGEAAVARALVEEMRGFGLKVEIQEVAPGRPNVVGTLEGRAPGRSMMFCGHTDTVGVAGMTRPFDPVERDGRIYGRGSQDMKSGVAAMIGATRVIAESGGLDAGSIVIACVVDEEHSSIGADALVTRWRADGAVVTEPTDLQVAVAHKGFEWIEIETEGRAAHGSRPREGRDAIRLMARVLNGLDQLDRDLQSRPPHPLLGTASLHASVIEGGHELSSYPDRCHLQMERRTVPSEAPGAGGREVEALLARLRREDPDFKAASRVLFARNPHQVDPNHALPRALLAALDTAAASHPVIGMSFWTDASVLGDAGIPAILFGPTGAGLHSVEEWVEVQSVLTCRDALVNLARGWCR